MYILFFLLLYTVGMVPVGVAAATGVRRGTGGLLILR